MRHDQIYNRTPHFFFGKLQPPKTYSNQQLARQHDVWEPQHWEAQQTFRGWLKESWHKTYWLVRGFFQPLVLLAPMLMLPTVLRRDRWMQLAAAMLFMFLVGMWGITWDVLLHYAAPVAPLALVLLVACMMEMAQRGRGWWIGLQVVVALFVVALWPTYAFVKEAQSTGPQVLRIWAMGHELP